MTTSPRPLGVRLAIDATPATESVRRLRAAIESVTLCRAARMVRLAQRAQRAGNTIRARRLATAARSYAGLPAIGA